MSWSSCVWVPTPPITTWWWYDGSSHPNSGCFEAFLATRLLPIPNTQYQWWSLALILTTSFLALFVSADSWFSWEIHYVLGGSNCREDVFFFGGPSSKTKGNVTKCRSPIMIQDLHDDRRTIFGHTVYITTVHELHPKKKNCLYSPSKSWLSQFIVSYISDIPIWWIYIQANRQLKSHQSMAEAWQPGGAVPAWCGACRWAWKQGRLGEAGKSGWRFMTQKIVIALCFTMFYCSILYREREREGGWYD